MFSSGPLRVRLVQLIATLGEEKKNLVAQTECSLGFENGEKSVLHFPKHVSLPCLMGDWLHYWGSHFDVLSSYL